MTSPLFGWRHLVTSLALLGGASAALAAQAPPPAPALTPAETVATQAQAAPAANPFTAHLRVSADGTAIIDTRSRLAWARCVEGMFWNGKTCSGQRRLLDRSRGRGGAQRHRLGIGDRGQRGAAAGHRGDVTLLERHHESPLQHRPDRHRGSPPLPPGERKRDPSAAPATGGRDTARPARLPGAPSTSGR